MKSGPAAPFYAPSRRDGAVAAVLGVVVYIASLYLSEKGKGTAAGGFVAILALSIRICWPLRKIVWFWVCLSILIILHVLILLSLDWSSAARWTGLTIIPFMIADITIVLSIIFFIFCVIYGRPSHLVETSSDEIE
jgi:hypothetical protein